MQGPRPSVPEVSAAAAALVASGALGAWAMGWLGAGAAAGTGVATGAGLSAVLALASSRPGLQWFGPAVIRGTGERKEVALTFDDGPDPRSTPALLDALEVAGARATFFVLADRVERHPDLARAVARGHEVGLHGLAHHPWLTVWPPERGAAELRAASQRLLDLLGVEVTWYRPAYGATSPRLARAVELAGLRTAWCSVRTLDGVLPGEQRLHRVASRVDAGDIVLLHEGARPAARALPRMLEILADRSLSAVTLGELLS